MNSKSLFDLINNKLNFSFSKKVPRILQTESSECGLACLAMVAGYYGLNVDMFNLRQKFGISTQGATLNLVANIASQIQLKTRPLSLGIEEVKQLKTPCILHWDMNHFVVLVKVRHASFVIHDPAFGRRVVGLKEMSQHFTGVALELWPDKDFHKETVKTKLRLLDLMKNIDGLPGALLKIFSLSIVIESINLLLPVGTQLVTDHVIQAHDHSLLAVICLGLVVFTLFRAFVSMIRAWTSIQLGTLTDIQWKTTLFDHLMKLPLAFFEKRNLGDIQSRFSSLDAIRTTFTNSIVSGIIDGIMTIGLFAMMMLYGGWLVWVVFGFTACYALMRLLTYRIYRQFSEEQIIKSAKAHSHFMETLYGISTIKALGINSKRSNYWLNLNVDATNTGIKITRFNMLFGGINTLITTIDQVAILWLGAMMVIDNNMTLGMFMAFNAYRGQFSQRASSLIDLAISLRMLSLHNERISDIVFSEAEDEVEIREVFQPGKGVTIDVKELTYQYDALSKPIFSDIDFSIQAGESVAIVGPSGAGKTTLLKVMCGLLHPTHGRILVDGIDIHKIGLNNFRRSIACVLQDDRLFSGSIAENICGFEAEQDKDLMVACAIYSNMHNEIMMLPMGYESMIGELGTGISGGQKQRLFIARALYRRPSILFLDEATSHLDLENESVINKAISSLKITRIIIAHRPSTIASADRVIDLNSLVK